jgi:hypothetical protein
VRLWDVSTQREVAVLEGHTEGVESVAFDGSGKYLASGGARGETCDGGGIGSATAAGGDDDAGDAVFDNRFFLFYCHVFEVYYFVLAIIEMIRLFINTGTGKSRDGVRGDKSLCTGEDVCDGGSGRWVLSAVERAMVIHQQEVYLALRAADAALLKVERLVGQSRGKSCNCEGGGGQTQAEQADVIGKFRRFAG